MNLTEKLKGELAEKYPDFDVACYEGDQPHYYYFVAVE